MYPPRKRQKVSSACQRCRQRKLGCDQQRPCQLCVRAGAACISRGGSSPAGVVVSVEEPEDSPGRREGDIHNDRLETVILPESSIVDLSCQILRGQGKRSGLSHDTSALPGGKNSAVSVATRSIPWRDLVGIPLPPKTVLDTFMAHFFDSVDWFMMIFHEESFRQRYENLMASTLIPEGENSNFLWLVRLVLGLGAYYGSLDALDADAGSMKQLSQDLLMQIEQNILAIIDLPSLETVQICVLLGSFHLFNGRPNAGLMTLTGGLKTAQVIGLHRELKWRGLSDVARETRRRSWWALEVADKYAAVAFGRPCTVDDSNCEVASISDIKIYGHEETRQGPSLEYHQWKFKLYRIVGPLLSRRLQANRLESLTAIHTQLSSWKNELPDKLRLETYKDDPKSESRIPEMQALVLQLTYDNLQIILHRNAAFGCNERGFHSNSDATPHNSSREQLLESALRTSKLHQHAQLLQSCRKTHAVMHIGICLFTAGVVLCAIALAQPLSIASQKAKEGVMRILRLQEDSVSSQHLLSIQSVQILRDLVTVVMRSEERVILGHGSSFIPERPGGDHSTLPISQADSIIMDQALLDDTGAAQPSSNPGALNSLQQVFRQHLDQSLPVVDPSGSIGPSGAQDPVETQQSNPSAMFSWDGNVSALVDAGLVDASQMWLWSDNLEYQSFSELGNMFP
ncbi:transcriptional regulator family: Fungal Specific TF [Aspergillus niger]|nr:transcriptional regulator family: Fungal Specific TF [Aspergillus niger]KAI2959336.1 transcriptional regulator family: Fungal Specific TF [Aspergillus niger]KAI2996633.1 transcriptional regulator family: Fungal Specific TF [Aspergillus niger]KAI3062049.1 transcriptional regulator family: Fungal Specific TF [Aspergillus niger]KAI3066894.1 transcriptional regulator family: Fungal Specific TF [Aspergillus niger]